MNLNLITVVIADSIPNSTVTVAANTTDALTAISIHLANAFGYEFDNLLDSIIDDLGIEDGEDPRYFEAVAREIESVYGISVSEVQSVIDGEATMAQFETEGDEGGDYAFFTTVQENAPTVNADYREVFR